MSKAAPWIKFFAGDFLNGVADLQADEIGVYTVILALIWDRGAPIPDDAAWLARRSGLSTRRFNQVRAKLISLGKLEARNEYLGNRRAIEEVEARDKKSDQTRNAALARWHGHAEPELPLGEDYLGNNSGKNGKTSQEQIDLKTSKSEGKRQKSANQGDADASSPSRARAFQRPESRITQPNDSPRTPRDPEPEPQPDPPADPELDRSDLFALLRACSDASGFNPVTPGVIAREIDIVKSWREAGIDFEKVVIPTIRSIIAKSSDPTSSLKRFDRQVRLEYAKVGAAEASGTAYREPPSPILEPEGEDERFRPIRADLLARLGVWAYCTFANPVRFTIEEAGNGDPVMKVEEKHYSSSRLMDGERIPIVRSIAAKHGFPKVW